MRCAALNTGPDFHLLDHICPLAFLCNMPLFLTEEKNFELTRKFYPQINSIFMPDVEYRLSFFAENFDALFECKYWAPHLKKLFHDLFNKEMRLVFCPHGQSDKGYSAPLLIPYATQDLVLLYGELMEEMLRELNIPANYTKVGNYRLSFYEKHKNFYDVLAETEIFSRLPPNKKTLLYAPTWQDADQATTFFQSAPEIFSEIPEDWNLILKLHPLLEMRDPSRFYRIQAMADHRSNILLVSEFPPVYPLLARADVYLGDYSSIGYDYLYFQKPMFFLSQPSLPPPRLHSCGTIVKSLKALFFEIENNERFLAQQNSLYQKAFGEPKRLEEIRNGIFNRLGEEERREHLGRLDA